MKVEQTQTDHNDEVLRRNEARYNEGLSQFAATVRKHFRDILDSTFCSSSEVFNCLGRVDAFDYLQQKGTSLNEINLRLNEAEKENKQSESSELRKIMIAWHTKTDFTKQEVGRVMAIWDKFAMGRYSNSPYEEKMRYRALNANWIEIANIWDRNPVQKVKISLN